MRQKWLEYIHSKYHALVHHSLIPTRCDAAAQVPRKDYRSRLATPSMKMSSP